MSTDPPPPEPGTSTVIVARSGPRDREAELELLRATHEILGLPEPTTVGDTAWSRPEFRLVEGVSRATADRLVGAAIRAGYRPRVRDKLGIRWSSERGGFGWLVLPFVAAFVPFVVSLLSAGLTAWTDLALGAVATSELAGVLYLVALGMTVWWQISRLYLPLLVSPRQVFAGAGPVGEVGSEPLREARSAVRALRAALAEELPDPVRDDLAASVEALDVQVSALSRAERALAPGAQAGLDALRRRREVLRGRVDADPEEAASLEGAIRDEIQAEDRRERRLAEVVRDLMAIRRAATHARLSLSEAELPDAVARLNREVEALKGGRSETDPRRAAAARARRARES